ncbi:MAG: hypothetical protein U9N49_10230, partial [Campylobacterota bacterium]|nr:hypothetical protein [Campylobacterota bacterium]
INTDSYRKLVPELSTAAIYQDYKIKNQIQELANEIQEFNKFELYDEDDGYGFWLTDELWFGVDYNLWGNNTLLVVMTQNKTLLLNSHEVPQNNKKEDEDWCYISIQGNREQIIKQIRKLLGN